MEEIEKLIALFMKTLIPGICWTITTLISLLGFIIVWRIWTGRINLDRLISEANGEASMARFQLLVFTFVISMSLIMVIISAKGGPAFPADIPAGILSLLGISGGSYIIAKGIQAGKETTMASGGTVSPAPPPPVAPGNIAPPPPPAGQHDGSVG